MAGARSGVAPRAHHIRQMADPAKRNTVPSRTSPNKTCPICGKRAEQQFRPFCSRRCADVDLNRWLSGVYAVPVVAEEEGDDLPKDPPPAGDDVPY